MALTLTEAREALAEALSAIDGLNVRPRPGIKAPRPGDGWVTVQRLSPSDFCHTSVTLVAVIILGSDMASSEDLLETWAVDAIDSVTAVDELPVSDVALEPISLVVDSGASLNAMTLTITTEVEA